ncbi:MAG: hypothetical protein U0T82_01745 [Bacteroidales bacterium]
MTDYQENDFSTETGADPLDIPYTTLNLGPTHPATHGIFQNILTMDGEKVLDAEQTIGYIHRAFEKIAERRTYYQVTPLTDRLNYCSSLSITSDGISQLKLLQLKPPNG